MCKNIHLPHKRLDSGQPYCYCSNKTIGSAQCVGGCLASFPLPLPLLLFCTCTCAVKSCHISPGSLHMHLLSHEGRKQATLVQTPLFSLETTGRNLSTKTNETGEVEIKPGLTDYRAVKLQFYDDYHFNKPISKASSSRNSLFIVFIYFLNSSPPPLQRTIRILFTRYKVTFFFFFTVKATSK